MAEIKEVQGFTGELSASQMRAQNPELYDTRGMPRMFPVHRHIHIYSVARRDFPSPRHAYWKAIFRGCTKGERYVHCGSIPDPPQQLAVDAERGGFRVEAEPRDEAGWRVAIDILNPNNPTLDPYARMGAVASAYFGTGQGVDMIKQGLFPSLNNPPTEEEIARAEKVRNQTWEALVAEAFEEQSSNPQNFRAWLRANPDINIAMEALGVEADWFRKTEMMQACPNCGDRVKAGIAFHKSSAGVLCIIDRERAARAGVKAKGEVN